MSAREYAEKRHITADLRTQTAPEVREALRMACELQVYCKEHNLPPTLLMHGVAWSAEAHIERAYQAGYHEGREELRKKISEAIL